MGEEQNPGEVSFDESAEYSPKSEFSKPRVVMETVQKCIEVRAKEMIKGYYNTTLTKDGLPIRTWISDSRKVYVSAITALRKLIIPEILEDEVYSKVKKKEEKPLNKIDAEIKKAKDNYSYYFFEEYTEDGKRKFKINKGKSFMPEVDSAVMVRQIFPDGNEKLIEVVGYWNKHINAYWDKLVELNDLLFEEMMRVIHRKNYFKQQIRGG